jgi:hypothetical protein
MTLGYIGGSNPQMNHERAITVQRPVGYKAGRTEASRACEGGNWPVLPVIAARSPPNSVAVLSEPCHDAAIIRAHAPRTDGGRGACRNVHSIYLRPEQLLRAGRIDICFSYEIDAGVDVARYVFAPRCGNGNPDAVVTHSERILHKETSLATAHTRTRARFETMPSIITRRLLAHVSFDPA